jgi:hypothetical protein
MEGLIAGKRCVSKLNYRFCKPQLTQTKAARMFFFEKKNQKTFNF